MFKEMLNAIVIGIVGFLIFSGVVFCLSIKDIPTEIQYYENNIKIDAIKYHNEIYLKKGE